MIGDVLASNIALNYPPLLQIFAFIDECDRRIRAAHRRLDKTPEENKRTTDLVRSHCLPQIDCINCLPLHRCAKLARSRAPTRLPWPRSRSWVRRERQVTQQPPLTLFLYRFRGQG